MDEKRGKEAFDLDVKIRENESKRRLLLAENAKLLAEVFDKKLYKELLGDEEGQWAGYLGALEIFYSRNQSYSLIRIYRKLTEKLGIPPEIWVDVPITRLSHVLPLINEENYADWFASAVSLTSKDWNIELRKHSGKISEEDEHEHDNAYYEICKICGKKHKLNPEDVHTKTDTESDS